MHMANRLSTRVSLSGTVSNLSEVPIAVAGVAQGADNSTTGVHRFTFGSFTEKAILTCGRFDHDR
jgi:hypothetical protein